MNFYVLSHQESEYRLLKQSTKMHTSCPTRACCRMILVVSLWVTGLYEPMPLRSQTANATQAQTVTSVQPIRIGNLEFWLSPPPQPFVALYSFKDSTNVSGCEPSFMSDRKVGVMVRAFTKVKLDNEISVFLTEHESGVRYLSGIRSLGLGVKSFIVNAANRTEGARQVIWHDYHSCNDIVTGHSIQLNMMVNLIDREDELDLTAIRIATLPTETPLSADAEGALWNLVKDTAEPELIEQYLSKYPSGRYAAQGREMLESLKTLKAPAVLYVLHYEKSAGKKTVSLDGTEVASIDKGTYFGVKVSSGKHEILLGNYRAFLWARSGMDYFLSVTYGGGVTFVERGQALERAGGLVAIKPKNVKVAADIVLSMPN